MKLAYKRGRAGEEAALKYFRTQGYYLLARNFRVRSDSPLSEIDLILLAIKERAPAELHGFFAEARESSDDEGIYSFVATQFAHVYIVFVEVKNWQAYPIADLCYNLSADRQKRMFYTAQCFLQRHPQYEPLSRRFDLVFFQRGAIRHIKAAFP